MNGFSKIILSWRCSSLSLFFASHSSVQEPTVIVGSANHRNVRRLSLEVKNCLEFPFKYCFPDTPPVSIINTKAAVN